MSSRATATSTVVDRFLLYVTFDTQSAEGSATYPSTPKQLLLLDRLAGELRELGLEDVTRSEHGVVMATIPATSSKSGVPVIGFMAHVDTSPEVSGAGVKPIVHRNWQGEDIVLPDDPTAVLRLAEIPALREQIGHDIITASGTTLLGADNKAGVAEIMAAAEYLMRHPEIPHGPVRVAFTPDEEIGAGAAHFDVDRFGAVAAYTMDAAGRGQLEIETFSADSVTVTFRGFNTHPGLAKDRMINAIKVAADFLQLLPRGGLSPETTEGREGFVHPYGIHGGVDEVTIRIIVRDFVTARLQEMEAVIEKLARDALCARPGASVSITVTESYRNMKEILDQHPHVVEYAREAIRRCGLELRENSIRGGTDGARLSFMGLPTPNLFAGENNYHSRLEWVSAQDMEKAVEAIVHLARIWEENA